MGSPPCHAKLTTGTSWDVVWSAHQWGVVPEIYPFFTAFADSLRALAKEVPLPDGFWEKSLPERRTVFFKQVLERLLPVDIPDDELIVGFRFNTALSRCLTKAETGPFLKQIRKWTEQAGFLSDNGIGNCGATPAVIFRQWEIPAQGGTSSDTIKA